ncbi:unnamed protein product [Adineta steineri]|uniref:Uncharacterized protein n=1 Tax=Adineta steineri TaxID=433720 RepID=A0A818KDT9_9BILA|nr:unnamed protein product [Adineta steineri]CAF3555910.1 unnamed protein product [Adineta steineri]
MHSRHRYHGRDVYGTRSRRYNETHRLGSIGLQQYSFMRLYRIVGHPFSIDKKFTIYENGNEQYLVRGGRLFGGINGMILEDRFGNALINIQKESGLHWHPIYQLLSNDGRELANIRKSSSALSFEINTVYGPYSTTVMSQSLKYFSIRNAHFQNIASWKQNGVEVAANQDQPFLLALIVVIHHLIPPPPTSHYVGR